MDKRRVPAEVIAEDAHLSGSRFKRLRELHGEAIRQGMARSAALGTHIGRPRATSQLDDAELKDLIDTHESLRSAWEIARRRDSAMSWSTFWRRSKRLTAALSNRVVHKDGVVSAPTTDVIATRPAGRATPARAPRAVVHKDASKAAQKVARAPTAPKRPRQTAQEPRDAKGSSPSTRRRAGDVASFWASRPEDQKVVRGLCSHGYPASEIRFKRRDGTWGVFSRSHRSAEAIDLGAFVILDRCDGTLTRGSKGSRRSSR